MKWERKPLAVSGKWFCYYININTAGSDFPGPSKQRHPQNVSPPAPHRRPWDEVSFYHKSSMRHQLPSHTAN